MRASGHAILITGGASGIGLGLAEAFLARGNTVAVCGRDQAKLDAAAGAHPDLVCLRADIGDDGQARDLIDQCVERMGRLSILVNNAGTHTPLAFAAPEERLEDIEAEIRNNLIAPMKLAKLALPHLLREPEAAIVNMSSGLGIIPKKSAPMYCASKAGLHAFSISLRGQLEGTPVRVFDILAPQVRTAMVAGRGAADMLTSEAFADLVIADMIRERYEMYPGVMRKLMLMHRVSPAWAAREVESLAERARSS